MSQTHPIRHRNLAAIALGIALAGLTWSAFATRAKDDRTVTTEILAAQTASSFAPASSHALDHARKALQRADQARSSGDTENARHLEGLAREWAEMSRDVARATSAESRADQQQRAAASATLSVRKTHAQLETLVARRARAEGELQQLHASSSAGIPAPALSAARLRPPQPPVATPKGSR